MGIGGQYSAINSAIDEMMPSKYRGRVDIWINGTYWAAAILGSFVSYIFLNHFAPNVGWRLAFTKPLTSTDQGTPTATVTPITSGTA